MKTAVYGSNYLSGPKTLYLNNPEDFENQTEAAKFQQFLKRPKIAAWQKSVIAKAMKEKKLTNPFGYSKAFWDWPTGDGPAAVAFDPQSIVAWIMRECMLQLWDLPSFIWMIWQIHDELVYDVPDPHVEQVCQELDATMNQPWPELGGLRIGVKIEVSENLV
jgi:hypothetical protein